MILADYQDAALRMANPVMRADKEQAQQNALTSMWGEGGEIANHVKKAAFQGHTLDPEHLKDELGDLCWYLALYCEAYQIPISKLQPGARDIYQARLDLPADPTKAIINTLPFVAHPIGVFYHATWTPMTMEHVVDQLQVLLNAIELLALILLTDLEGILLGNLAKLSRRYPGGVFSSERSINRA